MLIMFLWARVNIFLPLQLFFLGKKVMLAVEGVEDKLWQRFRASGSVSNHLC